MIYNSFNGIKISSLAFGSMRLPEKDGKPDEAAVNEMVALAMESGVNYFDTAWGYHNGMSETVMGKALSAYPRDRYLLATKFPGYDLSNMDKVEEIFEIQLRKCGVDYFDFYLFHNVCELNIDEYLDRSHGIYDYLTAQKRAGRIKHLGFSAHGSVEVMERFLAAYGDAMEFCQIQLNYLDYSFQDAKAKLELLKKHNLPVWVMEPVRGGRLASLPEEHDNVLKALRPEESTVAWAFRFLQSIDSVVTVLSGMSSLEQLKENIDIFSEFKPLSGEEMNALMDIAAKMLSVNTVPCTACRYCTEYCPMELDIPSLLSLYNEHSFSGGGFLAFFGLRALPEEKRPSACIGCGACAAVCPQGISIPDVMSDFSEKVKI